MIKIISDELFSTLLFFCNILPSRIGVYVRRIVYKLIFNSVGKKLFSDILIYIDHPKSISIGNNCRINRFCSLVACANSKIRIGNSVSINQMVNINSANGGEINIGDNVLIGSNVVIRASDHNINDLDKNINNAGHVPGKINICNNVWIASNCVILKNVTIEEGSVIGAGTIVTKDVKKNTVVASDGEKVLKTRA